MLHSHHALTGKIWGTSCCIISCFLSHMQMKIGITENEIQEMTKQRMEKVEQIKQSLVDIKVSNAVASLVFFVPQHQKVNSYGFNVNWYLMITILDLWSHSRVLNHPKSRSMMKTFIFASAFPCAADAVRAWGAAQHAAVWSFDKLPRAQSGRAAGSDWDKPSLSRAPGWAHDQRAGAGDHRAEEEKHSAG